MKHIERQNAVGGQKVHQSEYWSKSLSQTTIFRVPAASEAANANPTSSRPNTAFYRRLYIACLIDPGVNTIPLIMEKTGTLRRTVQDVNVSADINPSPRMKKATDTKYLSLFSKGPAAF
jgi:hypothetical protein